MTPVPRVELGEYETCVVAAEPPSPADDRLAERLGRGGEAARLDVRWLTNGTVEIGAKSWVGVVRFSQIEIHVVPKLVGGTLRVLRMLEYALGVQMLRRLPVDRPLAATGHDLLDLVCLLLTEEAHALVRDGLLRDYRSTHDSLEVLRGRLRYREQYLRRFGQLDRLECQFDEYDSDIPENQLVAAALDAARHRVHDRDVRFSALRLLGLFSEACEPTTTDVDWYERTIHYGRRNDRYRPAHELAKLVLRGLAFDDMFDTSSGGVNAFLINMNVVFERFVLRLVGEALEASATLVALPHHRLASVIRNDDTGRTYTTIDPDLVIEDATTGERVPVDVKYKLYDSKKMATADIYQAFLYAFALGKGDLHRGGILFPAATSVTGPALSIRQLAGPVAARIVAIGLDIPWTLDALEGAEHEDLMARVRSAIGLLTGMPAVRSPVRLSSPLAPVITGMP